MPSKTILPKKISNNSFSILSDGEVIDMKSLKEQVEKDDKVLKEYYSFVSFSEL